MRHPDTARPTMLHTIGRILESYRTQRESDEDAATAFQATLKRITAQATRDYIARTRASYAALTSLPTLPIPHSPLPTLPGYICEQCFDAMATTTQDAPWGGTMGVCDACARGTHGCSA